MPLPPLTKLYISIRLNSRKWLIDSLALSHTTHTPPNRTISGFTFFFVYPYCKTHKTKNVHWKQIVPYNHTYTKKTVINKKKSPKPTRLVFMITLCLCMTLLVLSARRLLRVFFLLPAIANACKGYKNTLLNYTMYRQQSENICRLLFNIL